MRCRWIAAAVAVAGLNAGLAAASSSGQPGVAEAASGSGNVLEIGSLALLGAGLAGIALSRLLRRRP